MSAASFAGILHLLQTDSLGWIGQAALWSFSTALPLLLMSFTKYKVLPKQQHVNSRVVIGSVATGCILAFFGLVLSVARVNLTAAGILLVASLVALILESKV
jgi:hypothetical protein